MDTRLIMELLFCCTLGFYALIRLRTRSRESRLPPGPPGYPIIGNIYDIGTQVPWVAFRELSRKYDSDIIHLNMFGTPLIVVNSFEVAQDLFVKRSAIYSDRPPLPMLVDLVGFGWNFGLMPYGELWKEHRKLFHKEFQPPATFLYRPLELDAVRTLLTQLLDTPSEYVQHLRHMAGTIILSAAYGIDVQPKNDPYVDISERALHIMSYAGKAGAYLVDLVPVLKYVPEFVPGAGFKIKAREWRKTATMMPDVPFEFAKRSIADGTARQSIASRLLEEMHNEGTYTKEKETVLRNVLGTMYTAGADTTVSSLHTFILAMVQHPEIQKKAQRQVDEVVGLDRLPDFSDQGAIPYVDALLREVLRWKPVVPLAAPHRTVSEDNYRGYHIPAGSTIIGNSWAMLYDESLFGPDTTHFNPERFLSKDGALNPNVIHPEMAFGFGRRQCPGQDMAESSIWIAIASILASFDIEKAVDGDGDVVEPSGEYTSGLTCYPCPFECTIRPRIGRECLIRNDVPGL